MIFVILINILLFQSLYSLEITRDELQNAQSKIDSHPFFERGHLQIFQPEIDEIPSLQKMIINTTPEDRECCIISYASYNRKYQELLADLIKGLEKHYKGHILYRIGGWPNMEDGCLSHCDVPYAFKTCAFKEAMALGYKKVLWLDTIVEPLKDLQPIFNHIEEHTCIYRYANKPFNKFIDDQILEDFNLTHEEAKDFQHIASGILGFNFNDPAAVNLVNDWHESVLRNRSFHTSFPEQIPLSILMHTYNLHNRPFGDNLVIFSNKKKKQSRYFFRILYARKRSQESGEKQD